MKNIYISLGLMVAVVACGSKAATLDKKSSGETPDAPEAEAGAPPVTDPGTEPPPGDSGSPAPVVPPVVQSCLDKCTAKHPTGVALAAKIDECWATSCKDPCLLAGDPSGKVVGPDLLANDAGNCTQEVLTPFAACSTCTVTFCCKAWDDAFSNQDTRDLNECATACWGK